jgi:hypothetical protein
VLDLLTPRHARYTSARALLGRAKTRVTAVVAEFRTSVAQPATQPEPADEFTPDELPAVELIEAAAREFDRAADQARRADRGKRAARKILDRLPAGTYGGWLVERVPSARQTADLDAIRAIFKANNLGAVPMKGSAPSLKVKQVPVTGECVRCERAWDVADLSEDGNGDMVCIDCHSSDPTAEDAAAARSYTFAGAGR